MSGSGIFSADNRFFSAMNKVADLLILNILFLFTVLIGIGPACTALYYATMKNIRRSRGYAWKEYLHSFKLNFKQGFCLGIIQAILAVLLCGCYWLSMQMNAEETFAQVYYTGSLIMIIAFALVSMFVYPILSRFTLSFGQWLKMSLMLSMRHLPTSFILLVFFVAMVLAIYVLPLLLFCLPALYCLGSTFLIERVFKRYMPKQEEGDETSRDAWYLD